MAGRVAPDPTADLNEDLLNEIASDLDAWDGSSNVAAPRAVAIPPPKLQPPPAGGGNESGDEELLPSGVEHTLRELQKALDKVKRKLEKSRAREASLAAELDQTKAKFGEMREEKLRVQKEAEAAVQKVKASLAASIADQHAMQQRKKEKQRRRLLLHDDDEDLDDEDSIMHSLDENGDDDLVIVGPLRACVHTLMSRLRRMAAAIKRALDRVWLRSDVEYIEARFGTSVSVYFTYSEMLCNLAMGNALLWLCVQIMSIIQLIDGAAPDIAQTLTPPMSYLPPKILYFSSYGGQPFGEWRRLSLAYAVTVVGYAAWYIIFTVRVVVYQRHRKHYLEIFSHRGQMAYAREVLTSWDVSIANKESLREQQHAALQSLRMLRADTEWRVRVKERTSLQWRRLRFRRVFFVALHVLLQGGVWAAIVLAQVHSTTLDTLAADTINNTFVTSLFSVVVYSVLIEIMPALCPFLVSSCRWDNPKLARAHLLGGYYLARVIGLVFIGISELGMLIDWADGTNGPRWSIGRKPARDLYECGQDQLASKFLQQAIIGFAGPKAAEFSIAGCKFLFAKARKKQWTRDPFYVEKKFIRNVYFQGLLWISIPYFPLMAFLMPLLLFLEFKLDMAYLLRLCNKTTSPFQGDLSQLLLFHTLTMLIFVAAWVFAFIHQYYTIDNCGPFWDATSSFVNLTATEYFSTRIDAVGGVGGAVLNFVFDYAVSNSYALWVLVLVLAYAAVDRNHRIDALQEYAQEQKLTTAAERQVLQGKVQKLERQVDKLKLAREAESGMKAA